MIRFFPAWTRRPLLGGMVASLGLLAASTAQATPVDTVVFADGDVLNVNAVIGTGSTTAYFAVDYTDGVNEAFQYNFNGALNGYQLLKDVEASTTLQDADSFYAPLAEHEIFYITDGSNTTAEYPALYYSPPMPTDSVGDEFVSSQGVTYTQAQVGADDLNVTNGEIVAFDNTYTAPPALPETSPVPEPTIAASTGLVLTCASLRRRRAARA